MTPASPQDAAAPLIIHCFGPLEVHLNGEPLPPLRFRKGQWLLALLALRGGAEIERDWLSGLIWPEDIGTQSLRNCLTDLRRALGDQAARLQAPTSRTLRLDLAGAVVDVLAFDAALASGDPASLEAAVCLYRGPLLEGCLEEWAVSERQAREQAYLAARECLAERARERGEWAAAERHLRAAVAADSLRESAQRALMQLMAAGGSYAAALLVYRELRLRLHRELNAEPDPETQSLFQQLRAEARRRSTEPSLRPLPSPPPGAGPRRPLIAGGTVTFLFTDIEGSSQLWEHDPEGMRAALARHDALLRQAIESHTGFVLKTVGDGFCAAFATAPEAMAAAVAAQRALQVEEWAEIGSLRVRMAVHTGAAEERAGDYFGPPLNRVARLLDAAHGGQILLSLATQELAHDQLPEGAALKDLGEHRLAGLSRPERIFQLVAPDLPADFPPLRCQQASPNNLPVELTRFIGREAETAAVKQWLATAPLLTLSGPGGTGKTRLALRVAARLLAEYSDGVWFVDLAPLADPSLVPQTVAAVLGAREEPGRPLTETLVEFIRPKALLLLLDNCEHLVEASARLAQALLLACPRLRVLATSREALGIAGEQTYPVPPLSLPDPQHLPPLERLLASEAVLLFVERAASSQPRFALSAANAAAVAEICCRLDGIPLAIELAAPRVKAISVQQINERLDDVFRLLTGGSRTALPRHQTLKAAIDWSYDLLSEKEKILLRRLSVFAGGWTLEAAGAVGAGGYPERSEGSWIETWEVMGLLTSLVEKSLVLYEEQKNEPRYRLLETVRQYARDRLLEAGEVEAVRRHQQFFLAMAQEAETGFWSENKAWLERIDRDYANLRAALELAVKMGDVQAGFQMAQGLRGFWMVRGYRTEGREKLATLLALPGAAARTAAKAQVLIAAGRLAVNQADFDAALSLLAESLEISRELGDKHGIAGTLAVLALVALHQGEWAAGRVFREESLALFREVGDLGMVAWSLDVLAGAACGQGEYGEASSLSRESEALFRRLHLQWGIAGSVATQGQVAVLQGNWDEARSLYQQALELQQEVGNKEGVAASLHGLGTVAQHEGDLGSALSYVERSLAVFQETGSRGEMARSLSRLGRILCDQGDYATACRHCQQSLVLWTEIGHKGGMAQALEGMAIVAGARGESEAGARLLGVAQALREDSQTPLPPSERAHYERCVARLRAALDEERLTEVWAEGRAMTVHQALQYALEHASPA